MARPRSITDERLLAAAGAVIARVGPGFTLAQVADECGVAVGSVAQRFGSKHGLLRALTRAGTAELTARLRELTESEDVVADPVAGLTEALVSVYSGLGDARSVANHLGQLGVDIGDGRLRALLGEHYAAVEDALTVLCARASGACGGRGPEPAVAARVLLATVNGAAMDWSIRPRGELRERLATDIGAITGSWFG